MLQYLIQLPCDSVGESMLGFLDISDIINFENAASSRDSQQLLRAIIPYCPPIAMTSNVEFQFHRKAVNWFNKRRCRVQHATIPIESLYGVSLQHFVFGSINLLLNPYTSLEHIKLLKNHYISQRVTCVRIVGDQDPAVMEVLFSLLIDSSVRSLDIESSNQSQWMEHMKKIGPCLHEVTMQSDTISAQMITTITECCPNAERLRFKSGPDVLHSNTLLSTIATNCPHIRSLYIRKIYYETNVEAEADLIAFALKCPLLEELSLYCEDLTDQSVIALAKHCTRLKKFKSRCCQITAASLIALSERGLPLEELNIPSIPILNTENAAQCAHALSRIRHCDTFRSPTNRERLVGVIQYMTGLHELYLGSSIDHLLVPYLLQGQCCADLKIFNIKTLSSITPEQINELVLGFRQLHTLDINKVTTVTDAVLLDVSRSCPYLQKVTLDRSKVTEEGVLTLAVHCRQLRQIEMPFIACANATIRKLVKRCRRLSELRVYLKQGEKLLSRWKFSKQDIKDMRDYA